MAPPAGGVFHLYWVMDVGTIMTARVVTVEMDDRLDVVKGIFDTLSFHHLLVIDDSRQLKGIVSDRDLLKALSPYVGSATETARDIATLNKRVHQIMSRNPMTLQRQALVSEAMQLFLEHRISCIPIVDEQSKPVGILSWRDVFKALLGSQRRTAG
jgi:acetoin utilization protein AcuB